MSDGGFYKLSSDLAARRDLGMTGKIVLAIMSDRVRQGKPVSIDRLARLAGTTRPAIRRAMSELEAAGAVKATSQGNGHRKDYALQPDNRERNVTGNESLPGNETIPVTGNESFHKPVTKRYPQYQSRAFTENNSAASAAAPSSQQGSLLPDDQPKPKRSAKAKLDTDPRVSEFVTWFAGEYEAKTNQKYIVQGGKDGGLVKTLLEAVTIGELKAATANMLTDGWGRQRASIGLLSSQINVWKRGASNGKSGSTNRRGMSASDWHREQAGREYPEQLHAPTIKIPRTG